MVVVVVGWWRVLIDARYDWYGWRWRFRLSTVAFLPNLTSIQLTGLTLLVYKYSVSTLRYAMTNLVATELVTILSTLSRCTALSPRVLRIVGSLFSL